MRANQKKTSSTSSAKTQKNDTTQANHTVEVLYQRMGDRWFAFSLIEDEVFVGSLTPEEIHGEQSRQDVFKMSGKA